MIDEIVGRRQVRGEYRGGSSCRFVCFYDSLDVLDSGERAVARARTVAVAGDDLVPNQVTLYPGPYGLLDNLVEWTQIIYGSE